MLNDSTSAAPETEESILGAMATFQPLVPLDETLMMTTGIVVAYVSNNHIAMSDLPSLIRLTYNALRDAVVPLEPIAAAHADKKATPAEIKRSITQDGLVSFIDGKTYQTLKRHLGIHALTPEGYRARFGLPVDYPMTAPAYSQKRSALAKAAGLGQQRTKPRPVEDRIQAAA